MYLNFSDEEFVYRLESMRKGMTDVQDVVKMLKYELSKEELMQLRAIRECKSYLLGDVLLIASELI